jgi:hypothetical protein
MTIKLTNNKALTQWRSWRPPGTPAGTTAGDYGGFQSNSYFDYYYSGCDIMVRFSEMPETPDTVPIVAIGYNITQQKVPIYGFWSYTYDRVALGTRIVQGTFAIPFQGPQYMYYLLAQAAENYDKIVNKPRTPIGEDEEAMEKYWGITRDEKFPDVQHLFLSHPPFDIIISYGPESPPSGYFDAAPQSAGDEVYYDINERFINPDNTKTRPRIFIENVNLTNMGTQIEPSGQPLIEAYTFFARDLYWEGQEEFRKK